jgi:serine protease AprX
MHEDRSTSAPSIRFGIRWDGGRRPKRLLAPVVSALLFLAAAPATAPARPSPVRMDVVVASTPARVDAAERLVQRLGGTVHRRLGVIDGFSASVPAGAVARLRASTAVHAVSGDARLRVRSTDPGAADAAASAGLVTDATGAGALGHLDGAGVGVALIDSGAVPVGSLARPGTLLNGPDFSDEGRDPDLATLDTFGHGTHLAGLIAGRDPLTGFSGSAPGAHVVSVKVAGANGLTSLAQVLAAFDWVRRARRDKQLNIRVLNVSLGVDGGSDYRGAVIAYGVEKLWADGIAVVAAAGNDGAATAYLDLPAADPYVIAVGATETQGTGDPTDDRVADFSSRSALRPPDVVAPGTRMVSLRVPGSTLDEEFDGARVGDGFFRGSGTSQAAAVVSGLAARLIAADPDLTPDQVKALLVAGAVDLPDPREADGAGRVDLGRAAALPVPSAAAVRQAWPAARVDLKKLLRGHARQLEAGGDYWSGRRWSGRRWSGMKWSGMKWSGMKWSGMKWSGMKWSAAAWTGDETG